MPLTAIGMSGVGDAPDPHDSPERVAAHFLRVRDEVVLGATVGLVAAALVGAFLLGLARRLHHAGAPVAALCVGCGAVLVALYFAGLHVVYTSTSEYVAADSPETAKGLFVLTILAVPALGAIVAVVLGAAALGGRSTRLLPLWWVVGTALGAAVAALAVDSHADSGWFSPDVQQQVVGNIVLGWVLVTAVVLAVRARAPRPPSGRSTA